MRGRSNSNPIPSRRLRQLRATVKTAVVPRMEALRRQLTESPRSPFPGAEHAGRVAGMTAFPARPTRKDLT
ncbi:hypothetical protein GCM10017674_66390 [Streptomyces gardneri]|uniref:Uncharacterized protein n=1 Tax=Streptomyces gardneri TaxID=66892 RepID=A0A4Y3RJL5_9ACTN|nr:hypothetical protein SGA01_27230 [Streptomyces gardneri]GHH16455.1 hypothetical protein GCM10017674_66390 [Streptomyces gardneri]